MKAAYLPRPNDFFPSTRRGHGRGLGKRKQTPSGGFMQSYQICAVEGHCKQHLDPAANVADWMAERKIKVQPW